MGGGPSPLDFISLQFSGQAPWFYLWKVGLIEFYFHPTWDLVPILYFQRFSPLILAPNLLWLQFQRDLGAPAPEVQNICFSFLSKFEDWAPDFSSTLARFYRGPMCEINSKGSDPPRPPPGPPQGHSIPKRIQEGRDPWILSDPNLRLGLLMLWRLGLWILFFILLEAWYLFYFQMPAPFSLGPTYTLDWKGKKKTTLIDEFHCKTGIKL